MKTRELKTKVIQEGQIKDGYLVTTKGRYKVYRSNALKNLRYTGVANDHPFGIFLINNKYILKY